MSLTVPSILKYLSNNSIDNEESGVAPRAKKRRLDHLTWEEKLQRKKLKNRVAAQTSRDRKKQRMEEMESALQELFLKNEALLEECTELREENKKLSEENSELQDKIENASCCGTCRQNRSAEYEVQHRSTESYPLPKGPNTHSAGISKAQTLTALWKIVMACLLYQTFSTNSTATSTLNLWSNSHRASFKISQQTWKLLLKRQIAKNQLLLKDQSMPEEWWGRHQKAWTPVDVSA